MTVTHDSAKDPACERLLLKVLQGLGGVPTVEHDRGN